jgi:hypothetical protein
MKTMLHIYFYSYDFVCSEFKKRIKTSLIVMDTLEFFLQQHSIEKSANTNGQYGFYIDICMNQYRTPMSTTEYNILVPFIKQRSHTLGGMREEGIQEGWMGKRGNNDVVLGSETIEGMGEEEITPDNPFDKDMIHHPHEHSISVQTSSDSIPPSPKSHLKKKQERTNSERTKKRTTKSKKHSMTLTPVSLLTSTTSHKSTRKRSS